MKPTLSHLALAIALAAMVGCEDQEARDRAQLQAEMDAMAGGQVQQQLNSEEAELKKYLAQMQAQDPKIKDLYYSVDANGQKQLHVVREKDEEPPVEMIPSAAPTSAIAAGANPTQPVQPTQQASASSGVNDFVWGLAGGMTAAMLMNSFSNGGMSGMTRSYPPSFSSYYHEEERRKRRNMATSGYVSYVNTTTRTRVSSSPAFQAKKAAITSRSSSVFKSAGSTRASTYSFGG
jgi:hypothetical protein